MREKMWPRENSRHLFLFQDAFYIGSDVSSSQLEIASTNVLFAGTSNVHLLQTDATGLFISSNNSVDSFGV